MALPGHGRYGQRRLLAGAPQFGAAMSATRVYFADVDGSGAADIVYAAVDHLLVFRNQSGNGYSAPLRVPLPLRLSPTDQISFSDIRGNGTTAIVITRVSPEVEHWACDLCADPVAPESGGKPYLLASTDNGLGATTTLRYASSTRFYLADKRAGLPWPRACPSPCRWSRRCAAPMRSPRCHSRGATPIATATSIRWRGCSVASAWWSWDAQAYAPFADTPDGNWPTARVVTSCACHRRESGPGTAWAPMNWLPPWRPERARVFPWRPKAAPPLTNVFDPAITSGAALRQAMRRWPAA